MGNSSFIMGKVSDQIAAAGEKDVLVFSADWCPFCKKAVAALADAGVKHQVIEIDGEIKSQLMEITGKSSVPQTFINGNFIGGCNDGGMGGVLPLLKSGEIQKMGS